MRKTALLPSLMLTGALTLSAIAQQQPAATSGSDSLTGCLKGSKHQYYVVEKDGTRHSLMAKGDTDLSTYVNHMVTVKGTAEASRNAAGSDTEGHRKGMFSVDSVDDQGACKK